MILRRKSDLLFDALVSKGYANANQQTHLMMTDSDGGFVDFSTSAEMYFSRGTPLGDPSTLRARQAFPKGFDRDRADALALNVGAARDHGAAIGTGYGRSTRAKD